MPAWGWWLASCLLVAAAIGLAWRSAERERRQARAARPADVETSQDPPIREKAPPTP